MIKHNIINTITHPHLTITDMKKILLVAAAATIGLVSCKKEETAKPAVKNSVITMGGDKKDLSGWD